MRLLNAGVDTAVIALWMGHEDTDTSQELVPVPAGPCQA